jgi:hypothetical protein
MKVGTAAGEWNFPGTPSWNGFAVVSEIRPAHNPPSVSRPPPAPDLDRLLSATDEKFRAPRSASRWIIHPAAEHL